MDEFLIEMAEIVEEDSVQPSDELTSFESWDSLAVLSVLAMADANFGVRVTAAELAGVTTVADLYQLIAGKKGA